MSWLFEKYPDPSILDHKPRFFLEWFLYTLFKKVQVDEGAAASLKEMHRQGTVIYVIKYRGAIDYLLYHYRLRTGRLPYPKVAFGLNMLLLMPLSRIWQILKARLRGRTHHQDLMREVVRKGVPALLCLIDPKGFKKRFLRQQAEPLESLLDLQGEMEKPVFLVPTLILYKQVPERERQGILHTLFGFRDNPGPLRKIFLFFRHHRRAFIDFGPPVSLMEYVASRPEPSPLTATAQELKELLIQRIDAQKRVILGPIMKSRPQIKEVVLNDPEVLKTIERLAQDDKNKAFGLRKKAEKYFEEIAADYSPTYVAIARWILAQMWNRLFQGIDIDLAQFHRLRQWARRGPLVFVPSHKSHVDYLVLNYVLFEHYLPVPRIAAGVNLAFWPMGHIFRNCGAFFIRRSFAGAKLYSKVFSAYVKTLLEEGYSIQFYIEGGRSRSGKLVLPKKGFLSIVVDAFEKGVTEDIIFVPVSVVYDRIPEEKSYIREQEGMPKEKESFGQIVKARGLLKRKYGRIYIRVDEPFSLKEYMARGVSEDLEGRLALDLVKGINRVTPVTSQALVSTAILARHRRGFHTEEMHHTLEEFIEYLEYEKAPLCDSLNDLEETLPETISLLTNWKVLRTVQEPGKSGPYYSLNPQKLRELEYYKNSIVHFFLPISLVASSILATSVERVSLESLKQLSSFLTDLLKNEFVLSDNPDNQRDVLATTLEFLVQAGLLRREQDPDQWVLTRTGFDTLPMWASLIKSFLEAYWIAAKVLIESGGETKKKPELLKRMRSLGQEFLKSGLVDYPEAISQITFKSALSFYGQKFHLPQEIESLSDYAERLYRFCTPTSK